MKQQNDNFRHLFRRRFRNDRETNEKNFDENDDDDNFKSSFKKFKFYQLRFNSTKNYFDKNSKKFRE